MDRDFAKVMMRHSDAVDLLLGSMTEAIRTHAPKEQRNALETSIFACINELHLGVRKPILDAFPDLDLDKK